MTEDLHDWNTSRSAGNGVDICAHRVRGSDQKHKASHKSNVDRHDYGSRCLSSGVLDLFRHSTGAVVAAHSVRSLEDAEQSCVSRRPACQIDKVGEHEAGRSLITVHHQNRDHNDDETGDVQGEEHLGTFVQELGPPNVDDQRAECHSPRDERIMPALNPEVTVVQIRQPKQKVCRYCMTRGAHRQKADIQEPIHISRMLTAW